MKKQKTKNPKMTQTTRSPVKIKKQTELKVHREGTQTYEAYADDYWDQAP